VSIILPQKYPLLKNGLIYFDSAALMPMHEDVITKTVLAMEMSAPIHRGLYQASEQATIMFNNSKKIVAQFINAHENEIAFCANTTDGINKIAWGLAEQLLPGDEIILSALEHHSNFVVWQEIAKQKKCKLNYVNIDSSLGYAKLDLDHYQSLLSSKTKIVSLSAVSNVTGHVEPVAQIVQMAHFFGAFVLIDAAQYVAHYILNVRSWLADSVVFSGQKLGAAASIGVIYLNQEKISSIKPIIFGGGMIYSVSLQHTSLQTDVKKLEAGTPAFVNIVSLAAAIEVLQAVGLQQIGRHQHELIKFLVEGLAKLGANILSDPAGAIATFSLQRHHPHDVAIWCDQHNIAVRAGDLCAQPLHRLLAINGSIRLSLAPFNSQDDIEYFIETLKNFLVLTRDY
jgi:cysteine desulfurase/selenocysteine lyase